MDYPLLQLLVGSILLTAVVMDLRSYRIPNWLTLPAMGCGMMLHGLLNGQAGLLYSAKGLGLGMAFFLILYLMGGMGAGDVKLIAAVGSFIGPTEVLLAGVLAALLGGVYAIAVMTMHWGVRTSFLRIATMMKTFGLSRNLIASLDLSGTQPKLRYGLVIALGTVLSQFYLHIWLTH